MPSTVSRLSESKRVTITSKRQVTIPQKFFTELEFDRDAVCAKGDGFLILYPAARESGGDFAEQILADLIKQGLSGQKLLEQFRKRQAQVRPAVEAMLDAAHAAAKGEGRSYSHEEVFGDM